MRINILFRILITIIVISIFISCENIGNDNETVQNYNTLIFEPEFTESDSSIVFLNHYPPYFDSIVLENSISGAPIILKDSSMLSIRAMRYSYNFRSMIIHDINIDPQETALIVIHPIDIDNGEISTVMPLGAYFMGTPSKNTIASKHMKEVLNPFIQKMRKQLKKIIFIMPFYSKTDLVKLYSMKGDTYQGIDSNYLNEYLLKINKYNYEGIDTHLPLILKGRSILNSYFNEFPGLMLNNTKNNIEFSKLPFRINRDIILSEGDLILFDDMSLESFDSLLLSMDIKNLIYSGYAMDLCVKKLNQGYEKTAPLYNIFVCIDAGLTTFPGDDGLNKYNTVNALNTSFLYFITQIGWIKINAF